LPGENKLKNIINSPSIKKPQIKQAESKKELENPSKVIMAPGTASAVAPPVITSPVLSESSKKITPTVSDKQGIVFNKEMCEKTLRECIKNMN
jgi:hypothetical protein